MPGFECGVSILETYGDAKLCGFCEAPISISHGVRWNLDGRPHYCPLLDLRGNPVPWIPDFIPPQDVERGSSTSR
jgi:hypothetical protein